MAEFTDIKTYRVTYGWLEVFTGAEDGTSFERLPVASFEVSYTLDQIPVAQVVPATGSSLDGGEFADLFWSTVADIGKNMGARLWVTINDKELLLIDGYISSISTQDESSPIARRMGASISIQGKAIKLAGAPSTSFIFSEGRETLPILAMKRLNVNIFSSNDPVTGQRKSINGIENYVASFTRENPNSTYWPAGALKDIVDKLYQEMASSDFADVADEVINPFTGAQLSGLGLEPTTYLKNVAEKFSSTWRSQNAWQALLDTSKYLMMHIVPFNKGFYIANPYSLDRQADIRINTGEYIRLKKSRRERLEEPVNGVLMRPPAGTPYGSIRAAAANYARECYAFPRPRAGNMIDGYYHYRQFPSWLYKERYLTVNKPAQGKPLPEAPEIDLGEDASMSDYYKRVGNVVARAIYGQLLIGQTAITINFPWRTDMMPGNRFVLENVEGSKISFIGSEMHGMVTSTQFRCNAIAGGADLSVVVQAVSLRNKADNDNDNLTFAGHPIFDTRWSGLDLFGNLNEEAPAAPAPRAATSFNAGTGENSGS